MSIKQIRQSRALHLEKSTIFYQLVVIEVVDCRRRSVHQKTSAITQWYVTGFTAQLSGFRKGVQK